MFMKRHLTMLMLALLTYFSAVSQNRSISGVITDADKKPLGSATVKVKGKSVNALTDGDGRFAISVPSGNTSLEVSSVGYLTAIIAVENTQSSVNIILAKSNQDLSEVVVTALGITRQAKKVGYATQRVGGQDLVKAAPPSIAQGLMGKVAGLNISVPNGVEGSSQKIQIRGNNVLLGNNQPLYVIDGVQMSDGQMGISQSYINTTLSIFYSCYSCNIPHGGNFK